MTLSSVLRHWLTDPCEWNLLFYCEESPGQPCEESHLNSHGNWTGSRISAAFHLFALMSLQQQPVHLVMCYTHYKTTVTAMAIATVMAMAKLCHPIVIITATACLNQPWQQLVRELLSIQLQWYRLVPSPATAEGASHSCSGPAVVCYIILYHETAQLVSMDQRNAKHIAG